ncbi:MAG TPA: hypothetical protein VF621_10235 [Pyrinomonadaceae bacterium]|jgi:hypothetical protein
MYYRTSLKQVSKAAGLIRKLTLTLLAATVLALPLAGPARAQTGGNAAFAKPRLISNAKKYRDAGLPAATGRSGSASLTARALLGKDGQTSVELTTGALDSATPAPGQIVKAQLKPLSSTGEATYARNFAGLAGGGTFNTNVNDLRRGQQVQAQANVTGLDPNRTDVVTVVETVKLRPDLSAARLEAPRRAVVNTAVHISAVVSERNGDVGAKAGVVLYVDGQAVDRAEGVWVDAGGTVSAAFTHTFASEGVKQLEVRVERVAPGDYDTSDNAAAGQVQIVSPQVKLSYYAAAYDQNLSQRYKSDYEYSYNDGSLVSRDASSYSYDNRTHIQDVYFYGWSYRGALKFPLDASVTELSDGRAVVTTSFPRMEADYAYESNYGTYKYKSSSAYRQDYATGYYVFITSYSVREAELGYAQDFTQVSYSRHAGDVTYHSAGTYSSYWSYGGQAPYEYSYSYNYDYSDTNGVMTPFGTQYGLDVSLVGADGTAMSASPRMTLVPYDNTSAYDFCWDYDYGTSKGRNCYEYFFGVQNKMGDANELNDTW